MPLALRIVEQDFSSPFAWLRGSPLLTRPGDIVEARGGYGLFAWPRDEWRAACHSVVDPDLRRQFRTAPRVLLLEYEPDDARRAFAMLAPSAYTEAGVTRLRFGRAELALRRARVVRELTADEVAAVAAGAPLDTLDGLAA